MNERSPPHASSSSAEQGSAEAEHAPSPVPIRWRLALALLRRLPQGALSRLAGWLAERRIPRPLRAPIIGGFARIVGADPDEAEAPPEEYPSISAFFTRRLRRGARSWPADPRLPTSPVDGVVGQVGAVRAGTLFQAKGMSYELSGLLASAGDEAAFEDGWFITLYLSPRHYHRIHAPVTGAVRYARAVPGGLLPVNEAAVAGVPRLFPRNERLVVRIHSREGGDVTVVAVGAFNVGRISTSFDEGWGRADGRGVTNVRGRDGPEERRYDAGISVKRGDELMAFHLGSTVVLLFSPDAAVGGRLHPGLVAGREIRLGAPLFVAPSADGGP